ncbi:MAG: hypothetical protein LBC42_02150 [Puniceicoccales bacterium]|jgi:hypothetical protein|nr:hypothetical protein [Puniceicoccales bacterium]
MGTICNALRCGVATAWREEFVETNPLFSNLMWLCFFPVRAVSTLAEGALLIAYGCASSVVLIISVLLKFKNGIFIVRVIRIVYLLICELLPRSFVLDEKPKILPKKIATDGNVRYPHRPLGKSFLGAMKEKIIFRMLWSLSWLVRFCLFALSKALITPASIVSAGARAVYFIGNGMCNL